MRFEGHELLGDEEVSSLGLLQPGACLTALLSAPQKVGESWKCWDFVGFHSDFTRILLGFYRDRMGFHVIFMEIHQGLDCWENVRRTPHQSSDDEKMNGDSMGFYWNRCGSNAHVVYVPNEHVVYVCKYIYIGYNIMQ